MAHPLLIAPIGRSLLRLAGPTTAVMAVQIGVAVAEVWFVARVGIDALAGIALVIPFITLVMNMANGGMGGTVTLTADAGNISAEPYADIAVDGGYGSGGGNGGAAGTVKVKAPNGAVTIESISAIGGDGDQGGSGGHGGTVDIAAGGDITMVPSYGFSVQADGGSSGQGAGGRGGSISLVSTGGSIVADATDGSAR